MHAQPTGQANTASLVTPRQSVSRRATSSKNTSSQVIAHNSTQQPGSASAMHITHRPGMGHADDTLDQEYTPQTKRSRQEGDDIDTGKLV